ncbi:MAG: calcineurin-like phosphoesterase C-terminal domain-containing protein [Bacteroidetes bacterium]|nr:calcineurin-like phosphoesterase C-terminal domain-containing protein [Bacteroidota bacterium]
MFKVSGFCVLMFLLVITNSFAQKKIAKGFVFEDSNQNGIFDKREKGIKDICISNGKDVAKTNLMGEWEIGVEEEFNVFVIKPSGYSVPLNEKLIPQYSFQKTNNNDTPESINFPLTPDTENKKFSTLFFGDTQARGKREVDFIYRDVVDELIGYDAAFGVSLGDNVADDPELMDEISQGIAQIGVPWYNTFGNHDSDREANSNKERDDTFEKLFGPSTYAFEYANVAFIGLNNIYFEPSGKYYPHFTEKQLDFVDNYLKLVPDNKLVVLYMHAPIVACDNKESMYKIIENREHCFSISGHLHEQINVFVDKEMGWNGKKEHHHLINSTVCGSWWCGGLDELGIPHATMNDGAPNGYSVITFDGNQYSVKFKAARRSDNYQMNIYLPNEINQTALDTSKIMVNVFAGSERSKVEMQMDKSGKWMPLEMVKTIDPECLRMYNLSPYLKEIVNGQRLDDVFGYTMDYPSISHHMWELQLPDNISNGTHFVTVRTTDMYNKTWQANRVFRVVN